MSETIFVALPCELMLQPCTVRPLNFNCGLVKARNYMIPAMSGRSLTQMHNISPSIILMTQMVRILSHQVHCMVSNQGTQNKMVSFSLQHCRLYQYIVSWSQLWSVRVSPLPLCELLGVWPQSWSWMVWPLTATLHIINLRCLFWRLSSELVLSWNWTTFHHCFVLFFCFARFLSIHVIFLHLISWSLL